MKIIFKPFGSKITRNEPQFILSTALFVSLLFRMNGGSPSTSCNSRTKISALCGVFIHVSTGKRNKSPQTAQTYTWTAKFLTHIHTRSYIIHVCDNKTGVVPLTPPLAAGEHDTSALAHVTRVGTRDVDYPPPSPSEPAGLWDGPCIWCYIDDPYFRHTRHPRALFTLERYCITTKRTTESLLLRRRSYASFSDVYI